MNGPLHHWTDHNPTKDPYHVQYAERMVQFMAGGSTLDERIAAEWDRIAELDFIDLCVEVGIRPSVIKAMVAGVDQSDELALDYLIRTGLHNLGAHLDDMAHLFIKALYEPREQGSVGGLDPILMAAE